MLNILISNDDGVYAPGLMALVNTLKTIAHVTVVAPDRNRSGASHSLTLSNPIRIKTLDNGFISVEGTPTDCVHIALTGLLEQKPDMVISGINEGANLSDDVWYSGTVAAAMEGRFLGLPAIAVSLVGREYKHYDTAAKITKNLVEKLAEQPLKNVTLLNVNVPDVQYQDLNGTKITHLGTRHCAEPTIKAKDPRGRRIFWIGPAGKAAVAGRGTDFHAVHNRYVSITPLREDITHNEVLADLENWMS